MTTIELKYKQLKDIIDNDYIVKMILNYSIETKSDLFIATIQLRKKRETLTHWDKYVSYSLIVKKTSSRIIGFMLELKKDKCTFAGFVMHSIYIIPEQRKKGYCKQILEIYSKTDRSIIADNVMTEIILKLKNLYNLFPRPNKDGSRNFHTRTHVVGIWAQTLGLWSP